MFMQETVLGGYSVWCGAVNNHMRVEFEYDDEDDEPAINYMFNYAKAYQDGMTPQDAAKQIVNRRNIAMTLYTVEITYRDGTVQVLTPGSSDRAWHSEYALDIEYTAYMADYNEQRELVEMPCIARVIELEEGTEL